MNSSNTSFSFETITNISENTLPNERYGLGLYVFGIIALLGICGNGLVIFIYLRSNVLRNSKNKTTINAILSLALTDLFAMACVALTKIILFILDVTMSLYVCLLTVPVPTYMVCVTQCVLCITTLDRYIAVCGQHRYSKLMTKRSFNILLGLAWLLPLLLFVLPFFYFNQSNEVYLCSSRYLFPKWILITQSAVFLIIMTITVSLYIPILVKAKEFHQKTYPAQFQGVNARTSRLKAKQQAIRHSIFIGVLTFIFMICNLPFSVVRFQTGIGYAVSKTLYRVTIILGTTNSVVNPFLYAFQNKVFRQETLKFLKCKCQKRDDTDLSVPDKNQLHHEQHQLPSTSHHACGSLTHQSVVSTEAEVHTLHANVITNKSHKMARPKVINVEPYQHDLTVETSL